MKWLFASLAVLFMVAPALAGEPYVGIVGNDIKADPFYLAPNSTQFLYDQTHLPNVPVCFGTYPPISPNTRVGGAGCEQFRSQMPTDQQEVCDTQGKGKKYRGLPNAKTMAGFSGWYEWWIRLPKTPTGQIKIGIQCGVLIPNAFTGFGFNAVSKCAAETGERIGAGVCVSQGVEPGVSPVNQAALPKITAIAYPGPYNTFYPFHLTAFKNPSTYILTFDVGGGMVNGYAAQLLDGSTSTRVLLKACQDSTIVTKLPVTGQINAVGDVEMELQAGDLIYVRMDVPEFNTVDIYCHAQSARLTGEGEAP